MQAILIVEDDADIREILSFNVENDLLTGFSASRVRTSSPGFGRMLRMCWLPWRQAASGTGNAPCFSHGWSHIQTS